MDCKTSYIDLEDHLTAMLRVSAALIGLPIVAVSGHTSNAMICAKTNHLDVDALLKLCIGVDSCNQPAIRVKFINSCTLLSSCKNKSNKNSLRRMFAYDSTSKTYALVINQSV